MMWAFKSYGTFKRLLEKLVLGEQVDPDVAVLTLQSLYQIEEEMESGQFVPDLNDELKKILRRWRESPLTGAYKVNRVHRFLRKLTIFKTLKVPLFIDNYGAKRMLTEYETNTEDIPINGQTKIFHVTHQEEAESIIEEKKFKPSDAKNIIPGCWFGLQTDNSHYGTHVFKTTLSRLNVTGLRQGEIVSYKDEVNVILYADEEGGFAGLKKPTAQAVKGGQERHTAYVNISIFVPERFFKEVLGESYFTYMNESGTSPVSHTMCVREKRTAYKCKEKTAQ